MIGWIQFLGAEAGVVARYFSVLVVLAALGAVPMYADLFFRNILATIIVVGHLGILLNAFLASAVVGPALNTGQVEEVVAIAARPYLRKFN